MLTIRVQVDRAAGGWAARRHGNFDGNVEAVDERHIIVATNRSVSALITERAVTHSAPSGTSVNSATVAGGTPVPVFLSHSRPPLQAPVAQLVGPGLIEKSHSVRGQIRPDFQLSGTEKVVVAPAAISQPVAWDGTAVPTLRSV